MTDPNDKLLDEYMRRESIVSQRYREIEADEVPPQIDAAVLAQARAATTQRGRSKPAWMKWSAPLALAASAVLIVAIVLEVGVQEEVRLPAAQMEQKTNAEPTPEARAIEEVVQEVIQEAPPAAAPPPPKLETPAPSARAATRERNAAAPQDVAPKSTEQEAIEGVAVTGRRIESQVQDSPLPVTVVVSDEELSAAPSEADVSSDSASAGATAEAREQARADRESDEFIVTAQRRQRSAPVPPRAVNPITRASAPAVQQAPRLAPAEWLEQIRKLRREGKVLEADEQWKEFSEAYPDFEVAESDLARPKP